MLDCERVDEVKEESLIVVKVLRGKGTKEDMCRHVHMYYQKQQDGSYKLLFVDDPLMKKANSSTNELASKISDLRIYNHSDNPMTEEEYELHCKNSINCVP